MKRPIFKYLSISCLILCGNANSFSEKPRENEFTYLVYLEDRSLSECQSNIFVMKSIGNFTVDNSKHAKDTFVTYNGKEDICVYNKQVHNLIINGGRRLSLQSLSALECCGNTKSYRINKVERDSLINLYNGSLNPVFQNLLANDNSYRMAVRFRKKAKTRIYVAKVYANYCVCRMQNDVTDRFLEQMYLDKTGLSLQAPPYTEKIQLEKFFDSINY